MNISSGFTLDAQAFGEVYGNSNSSYENAMGATKFTGGNSAHYNVSVPAGAGINGNASADGSGINMFADPVASYAIENKPVVWPAS